MKPLLLQRDFDEAERGGRLVGVFDKYTGDRLHLLPCAFVRGHHFHEKVVLNGGKNGHYVQYQDFDEVPQGLLDRACKQCFHGISSLSTLLSSQEFRSRIAEHQRLRAADVGSPTGEAHRPVRAVAAAAGGQASGDPLVRWRDRVGGVLEAWCSRQLDLQSKAPDVRGLLRAALKAELPALRGNTGDVLYATFIAPGLLPNSDVENVLLGNVDAFGGAFAHVAASGVVFEFWPENPSAASGAPPLECCSIYELDEAARPSLRWREGDVLASWDHVPVRSLQTATRSPAVWWELRHGPATVAIPKSKPHRFAVHLVLHVPAGQTVNAAGKVKVAVDAAVLALTSADGTCPAKGLAVFAAAVGQPVSQVRAVLEDRSRAVFGVSRAVTAGGNADPPDAGCFRGSLMVRADGAGSWELSGRVVALESRSS